MSHDRKGLLVAIFSNSVTSDRRLAVILLMRNLLLCPEHASDLVHLIRPAFWLVVRNKQIERY